jgi:hypothetical protein
MKALARDFSIRHPGESRGPFRVSLDWIPASAGMTEQRIPRRDFQVNSNRLAVVRVTVHIFGISGFVQRLLDGGRAAHGRRDLTAATSLPAARRELW